MAPSPDSGPVYEHLSKAVALLTAWHESEDEDQELVARMVASYLDGATDATELAVRVTELSLGLLSLSGHLLLELSRHAGQSPGELLEIIGRRAAGGT